MKGIVLVCLFYASLPFLALAFFSMVTSGFPVFPLLIGGGMAWVAHRNRNDRGSHYQK